MLAFEELYHIPVDRRLFKNMPFALSLTSKRSVSAQMMTASPDPFRSQICQKLYLEEFLCWSNVAGISNNRFKDNACDLSWVLVEEGLDGVQVIVSGCQGCRCIKHSIFLPFAREFLMSDDPRKHHSNPSQT